MSISAKSEYACLAMLELAKRYDDPKPIRLAEIADQHDIPQRFLVQILLQLKGNGLVQTTRGAAGGYQLTRKPTSISLADILDGIDRDESSPDRPRSGSPLTLSLRTVWKKLSVARESILRDTTLSDLLPHGAPGDYMI
ncbi:Rrf2 family transcriptional regulator [soil metagenome]